MKQGQEIPIGQFGDEAILARELRQLYKVSDDGQFVFRQVPDYFESDLRTIYVECCGSRLDELSLREKFGKFGDIENLKMELKYSFITYKAINSVELAVNNCPYTPLSIDPFLVQDRVISKLDWNRLMAEYYHLRLKQLEIKYTIEKQKAAYEKGCIVHFQNFHPKTNSRTIKMLFELVSQVVFIDYGDKDGYCRFKNSKECKRALNYFSRCNIVQQHPKDTTGQLDAYYDKRGIELRLLEGREEKEYWKYIFEKQNEKLNEMEIDPVDNPQHLKFNEDEEDLNPRKRKLS